MSAASPRQYSAEVLVNMILGTLFRRSSVSSRDPWAPVTGVGLRSVGKGEHLRNDIAHVLGGLPEAEVELAAHTAGDVGDDSVQRRPVILVVVETDVNVLAQEASALGTAHSVSVVNGAGARIAR